MIPARPPRIAFWLLMVMTGRSIRSELVGDLQEEFTQRHGRSARLARNWYWRQLLFSLPSLVVHRLRSRIVRQYAFGIAVSFAAFGLVRIWDVLLARNLAGLVASIDADFPLVVARISYFAVMMLGIGFAGALVARATFCLKDSFLANARRSLAPASLAIFAPYLFYLFLTDQSVGYYPFIWMAAAVPSLIGGARFAAHMMSVRAAQRPLN